MNIKKDFDSLVSPANWEIRPMLRLYTERYFIQIERISYIASKQYVIARHEHPNYEFHFCPCGGTVRIETEKHSIRPGDFYITGPHVYHSQISDEESLGSEFCLMADISPLTKAAESKNILFDSDLDNILDILTENKTFFGRDAYGACSHLKSIYERLQSSDRKMNLSEFWLTILQVLISAAHNIQALPQTLNLTFAGSNLDMERISYLDRVFRSYHEAMSPRLAAEELHISVRQLNRITEKFFGMTFKQKYIQSRMQLAADLLKNIDGITIDTLSQKLNFSSSQHFSRTFKKFYGVCPSEYSAKSRFSEAVE
ncbi:MAG: helix-turn-helix domain-containing protein [Monoglobaceae bacterium]